MAMLRAPALSFNGAVIDLARSRQVAARTFAIAAFARAIVAPSFCSIPTRGNVPHRIESC
jgi:hypothetical protein